MTSRIVPYTGPLTKLRPIVKWVVITYYIVWLLISTLILHEQTLLEFFFLRPTLLSYISIVWLMLSRNGREVTTEPIELYLYTEHFVLVKPQTLVRKGKGEAPRRDTFTMRYADVQKIRYDYGLELVTVTGKLHSEFFDYAGDERPGVAPKKQKTVTGAAAFWYTPYMPEGLNEEIITKLSELTGTDILYLDTAAPERRKR